MVTFRTGKTVQVTRLVLIKPKRAVVDHHGHHHHHHVQQTMKREIVHHRQGHNGKRFINRRAELLQYSRCLRESAKLPIPTPPTPQPSSSNNQQPKTRAVAARRKPESPSCLCNCKISMPNFFKIMTLHAKKHRNKKYNATIRTKIKAVTKGIQVRKRRGFFSKLFLKPGKYS